MHITPEYTRSINDNILWWRLPHCGIELQGFSRSFSFPSTGSKQIEINNNNYRISTIQIVLYYSTEPYLVFYPTYFSFAKTHPVDRNNCINIFYLQTILNYLLPTRCTSGCGSSEGNHLPFVSSVLVEFEFQTQNPLAEMTYPFLGLQHHGRLNVLSYAGVV